MRSARFTRNTLSLALALLSANLACAAVGDLELYVDSTTKQIFAEPGPNRVKMGTFRPVTEAAAPAATSSAISASAAGSGVPVVDLSALETKVKQQDEKIASLAATQNKSGWTNNIQMRGYAQLRYNEMVGGDRGINLWTDRSVGDQDSLGDSDKNLVIRRARVVIEGSLGSRASFKIEPDFSTTVSGSLNVVQIREAFGEINLTDDKVNRVRIGATKVPFGFQELMSSSAWMTLDSSDAFESAVKDERDTGAFYFYTPKDIQARFSEIAAAGLKHTGNYGLFAVGAYNGEGLNKAEKNDGMHWVARATYPWKFSNGQFFEASVQAYTGEFVPTTGAYRAAGDVSKTPIIPNANLWGYRDRRVGVSAVWFPQPFGVQAEWNWGKSPQLDLASNTITDGNVDGGYLQAMYMIATSHGSLVPFIRWQSYSGGNKLETNAPYNEVNDTELGLKWLLAKEVEFTTEYHHMNRNNLVTGNRAGRIDYQHFNADALRFQVQFNY